MKKSRIISISMYSENNAYIHRRMSDGSRSTKLYSDIGPENMARLSVICEFMVVHRDAGLWLGGSGWSVHFM